MQCKKAYLKGNVWTCKYKEANEECPYLSSSSPETLEILESCPITDEE